MADIDLELTLAKIKEAIKDSEEAELQRQSEEAGERLARTLAAEYDVEELGRRSEYPYMRQILMGSRDVAEYNAKRRKEHEQRMRENLQERTKRSKCSIFNAYDTIIGRIPSLYQRELKEITFRDSQHKLLKHDTYVFPDLAILQNEGYRRLHTEHWRELDSEGKVDPPCFYPMKTRMSHRRIKPFTKDQWEGNLETLGLLGNKGPLGALPNAHWSLFFCNLPRSFQWLFRALRALQGDDLHDVAGDLVPGNAFEYAVRLCPVPNFYQELYATMGNHVILIEDLEKHDFTDDLIASCLREGFHPQQELAVAEPSVEVQMADLLDTLFTHFKFQDRSQLQPLMTKILDYICPGVLEVIKSGK